MNNNMPIMGEMQEQEARIGTVGANANPAITARIMKDLKRIEKEQGVTILYAAESGSRAWGFESENSDYDIRFIFMQSVPEYLSVNRPDDVLDKNGHGLEKICTETFDYSGWDIFKAAQLFCNSNPPLLEWLQSPIVYIEKEDYIGGPTFANGLRELAKNYSPKRMGLHHLHLAKGNWIDYLEGQELVSRKKYLYVIRSIMAAMFIDQFQEAAPVAFDELYESVKPKLIDMEIEDIDQLLADKRAASCELEKQAPLESLNDMIRQSLGALRDKFEAIEDTTTVAEEDVNLVIHQTLGVY